VGVRVILTEKPSVAKDFAKALGASKEGAFYRKGDTWIAFARGHLFEIADENAPKKWEMATLPILPEKLDWAPKEGVKGLLGDLAKVLKQADEVIIATDPGREGELIARIVLSKLGWRKWDRTYRFWTAEALTPPVVRKALGDLKPASNYESLYYSALARAEGDWLVGINFTRAVSLGEGGRGVWSVGRVQTPTLRLVVEREKEIRSFTPTPYGVLKGKFRLEGGFVYQGTWRAGEPHPPLERVREVEKKLRSLSTGKVAEVKEKEETLSPPLLHNLASLQRQANALYGLSAKRTLEAAQSLYETHKVISYPRTESRHLPESAKGLVEDVLKALGREDLIPQIPKVGKRVFDDQKLTDHHAIIPLAPLPPEVNPTEAKVYGLIRDRFLASLSDPAKVKRVEVLTEVGGEKFVSKFRAFLERGWTVEESHSSKEKGEEDEVEALFPGREGENVRVEKFEVEEKKTTPPPRYTEGSLIKLMEKLGLGTPATRADILETLKTRGYVTLEKRSLVPTEKAFRLLALLEGNLVSDVEMTSQWEKELDSLWRKREGREGYLSFVTKIKGFVQTSLEELKKELLKMQRAEGNEMKGEEMEKEQGRGKATEKMLKYARSLAKQLGKKLPGDSFDEVKAFIDQAKGELEKPVGTCACGKPIKTTPWGWKCEGGHAIFKETFGTKLKEEEAIALLKGEGIERKGLTGKSGKPFAARLIYNHQEGRVKVDKFL
jgi:DNA topoisomerase-3